MLLSHRKWGLKHLEIEICGKERQEEGGRWLDRRKVGKKEVRRSKTRAQKRRKWTGDAILEFAYFPDDRVMYSIVEWVWTKS